MVLFIALFGIMIFIFIHKHTKEKKLRIEKCSRTHFCVWYFILIGVLRGVTCYIMKSEAAANKSLLFIIICTFLVEHLYLLFHYSLSLFMHWHNDDADVVCFSLHTGFVCVPTIIKLQNENWADKDIGKENMRCMW